MNSRFGEVFLFLTDLAWKSRVAIPVLVTTVFLIMDIRLQIEVNIQSGQIGAAELEDMTDSEDDISDDDEYTTDDSNEYSSTENVLCLIGNAVNENNSRYNNNNEPRSP